MARSKFKTSRFFDRKPVPRRISHPPLRRPHFEALEPRILLSADSLLPGLIFAMDDGLSLFVDKVQPYVADDLDFQTLLPGLLQLNRDINDDGVIDDSDIHIPSEITVSVDNNRDGKIQDISGVDKSDFGDVYDYVQKGFGAPTLEQKLNAMDLNNDRVVDWGEAYKILVVGALTDYLNDYSGFFTDVATLENSVTNFLNDLAVPTALNGLFTLDLSNVTANSDANLFGHEFDLSLTLRDRFALDLGISAGEDEISLPTTVWNLDGSGTRAGVNPKPEAWVSQTLTMPFLYAFDIEILPTFSDPLAVTDFNFFTEKMSFSIDANQDLTNLIVNVGFLGTQAVAGSSYQLNMDFDVAVFDPSSPINLGFADEDLAVSTFTATETDGVLEASNVPRAFTFTSDIFFTLKLGANEFTPVEVRLTADMMADNVDLDGLRADLQLALSNAGLAGLITAGVSGDRLTLSLPQTDASPLGFTNEAHDDDLNGTVLLAATNAPISFEFANDLSFLLSINGALPRLITVPATDPAIEELGFAPFESAALANLIATSAAPANGKFTNTDLPGTPPDIPPTVVADDKTFTITITDTLGVTVTQAITIAETAWSDNATRADLVADINAAIGATPLNGKVSASLTGSGRIILDPLGTVTSLKVAGADAAEFGFTAGQATYLAVTANAVADAALSGVATFDVIVNLTAGGSYTKVVTVPAMTSGTDLVNYLAMINSDLAGSDIIAVEDGGRITLQVKATEVDDVASFEVKVPRVTKGNTTIDDLVEDLNRVLDDMGISNVQAQNNAGQIELTLPTDAVDPPESLEITRTIAMEATNHITYEEWTTASNEALFEATADESDDVFKLTLDLDPRAGINFTPSGNPTLTVELEPFTDPLTIAEDGSGIERFDLPLNMTDFEQYLDFNVIGPGEIVGLITQLIGWLDRLPATYMLGNYSIPFAKAVLGDILDFGDMVEDTLLINDGDDGIQPADYPGAALFKFVDDPNSLTIAFGTAQELAARLKTLGLLKELGTEESDIWADYDEDPTSVTYRQLIFHLSLEHNLLPDDPETAVNDLIVPVDFSLNLDPLNNLYSGSKVSLQAYGYFDAILGIAMGEARTLSPDDLLNSLNISSGKTVLDTINKELAITGAADVAVIEGRLTASQAFQVILTVEGSVEPITKTVMVTKTSTDENREFDDLKDDINAAIAAVLVSGEAGSGTEVYLSDFIEARLVDSRVQLVVIDETVQSFEVAAQRGYGLSQLGLIMGFANTVQTGGYSPIVGDLIRAVGGAQFDITLAEEASVSLVIAEDANNNTVSDLINDINSAIVGTVLEGKILAVQEASCIVFKAIHESVTAFTVESTGLNKLGFSSFAQGTNEAPANGRLSGDVVIGFNLYTQSLLGQNFQNYLIEVTAESTATNTTVDDLIKDINKAIQAHQGLVNRVVAEKGTGDTIVFRSTWAGGYGDYFEKFTVGVSTDELGFIAGDLAESQASQEAGVFLRAAQDVALQTGRLSAPATFEITLNDNATAHSVTIPAAATSMNTSVADLVADINRAIDDVTELQGMIRAELSGNFRIVLRATDLSVASFTLTASAGDPAVTELGFGLEQFASPSLNVLATKDAPSYLGIASDATFTVSVTTFDGTENVTVDKVVTIKLVDTLSNQSIFDLVSDVNRALNTAFGSVAENPLIAGNDGNRLTLSPKTTSDVINFTINADVDGAAIQDLKLYDLTQTLPGSGTAAFNANEWDLLIRTSDGVMRPVTLDYCTTIQGVIDAIEDQTNDQVEVLFNKATTGLNLVDKTGGTELFLVDTVNGSGAAYGLGLFGADTNSMYEEADAVIEGQAISPLKLADRLFLRQVDADTPILSADITLLTDLPNTTGIDQLEVEGNYGFVGVTLTGGGTIEAVVAIGLQDSLPAEGVKLSELIQSFSQDMNQDGDLNVFDLAKFLEFPTVDYDDTNNKLEFVLAIDPPLAEILLEAAPTVTMTIANPGNPFYAPAGMNHPFDPATAVSEAEDTLSFAFNHGLYTGNRIIYSNGPDGKDIGGLVNGNTYFVIREDFDTIKLASTLDNAEKGIAINLTSTGTGTAHSLDGFRAIPSLIDVDAADINALANFEEITFEQFLAALKGLNDFLQEYANQPFLAAELPLIGVSINDLVGIAERFNTAVVEIEQNQAGSLQLVKQKLSETFGQPYDSNFFTFMLVDNGVDNGDSEDMLKVVLDFSKAFSQALPIGIDLTEVLPGGLDIDALKLLGTAGMKTSGSLAAKFTFGVDLDDLEKIYLFTNEADTSITGELVASADNLAFNAALGSLGVYVKEGNADFNLNFGFATDDAEGSRVLIGSAFADFVATLTGGAEATLPVFFPNQSNFKGDIDLSATFGIVGGELDSNITLDVDTEIFELDFSNFNLFDNIALMIEAGDLFLMGLQDILDGEVFGFSLPIVGDKLSAGADFIEDFRLNFIQPFRTLVEAAPEKAEALITGFIFDTLMATGLLMRLDGNALDGSETIDDFIIVSKDLDPNSTPDFAQWNFVLGQTFTPNVNFDFDLGFPALGLDADVGLDVEFAWSLGLGFGISLTEGAYIDITREDYASSEEVKPIIPELEIEVRAVLNDSSNLSGQILFLELVIDGQSTPFTFENTHNYTDSDPDIVDLTPDSDATQFFAKFSVDLINANNPFVDQSDQGDQRLALSELGSLDFGLKLQADAEVNLLMRVQFNEDLLPSTIAALLPAIETGFVLDWQIDTDFSGDFDISDGLKYVAFQGAAVDLGSFLGDLIVPIVDKIQEVTGPIQPIIDVITERIPVLSDLAGRTITLVDLAATFGEINPDMIYAIADIVSFVNSIPTEIDSLMIPLGDFVIFGSGIVTAADLADPNFSFASLDDSVFSGSMEQLFSDAGEFIGGYLLDDSDAGAGTIGALKGLLGGDYNTETDNGKYGFAFPILEDLSQVFGLLLGKPAVLVTYDLPPFFMDFTMEISFPIYPPLYGVVSAGVGLQIDFAFGYDTQGIQDFIEGGGSNPLDLLSGLYISDTDRPDGSFGTDVPELKLWGGIGVGAELNLGIASAGVMADISITFNFDLYDPDSDGRVRITELVGTFMNEINNGDPAMAPLSIFDIYGDIAFQLSAYIEIFFAKFDFEITPRIVIWEFSIPFERAPILATERGDGSLLLNIGPNSGSRLNGDTRDIGEDIYVKDAGAGKVAVWGMGVAESAAQTYSVNSKGIYAYGGEGNDIIDLSRVNNVAAYIEGGSGNDILLGGGKADTISGGVGDDTIDGGGDNDRIWGNDGHDTIHGGAGIDIIFGDSGFITTERITALGSDRDGNDKIWGDGDADVIFGGGGDDEIYGGDNAGGADGDDLIFGDSGRIELTDGVLPMADGNYDLTRISARGLASGNDKIFGNAGGDTIFAGKGDDIVDGGAGDDRIFGNEGFDTIYGGGGTDQIWGGTEDDRIFGGRDDLVPADQRDITDTTDDLKDTIYGEDGNDFIRGNLGNDLIYGGRGADIIFGDEDDDEIYGESDPDFIFGGAGADYIEGQTGSDYIFGDDGIIVYVDFYGTGSHKIIGLVGGVPDIHKVDNSTLDGFDAAIRANDDDNGRTLDLLLTLVNGTTDGNDTVIGGEGDDIVFGGAKDDIIFGDLDPAKTLSGPVPSGADILIGDGGRVQFFGRRLDNVRTVVATSMAETGADTISGNGGNDLLLGGGGNDILYGRMNSSFSGPNEDVTVSDDDIIIGDDGEIDYTAGTGVIVKIATTISANAITTGGVDTVYGNKGDDIIFGGMEGDTLYGDGSPGGDDIILGDNGQIDFTGGVINKIFTTDTSEASGGSDTIEGQEGSDIILGGVADDFIYGDRATTTPGSIADDGNDVILGDNGLLDFAFGGDTDLATIDLIQSFIDGLGGRDIISGNAGEDTVLGGTGGDLIYGDNAAATAGNSDGDDILLGDNGIIRLAGDVSGRLLVRGSAVRFIHTSDENNDYGGADTISGNAGADLIIGGVNGTVTTAQDQLYGDAVSPGAHDASDVILGDNGLLHFAFGSDTDLTTLDIVATRPYKVSEASILVETFIIDNTVILGGDDLISGNVGADTVFGGVGSDTIYGDNVSATAGSNDGDDMLLGDNGQIDLIGTVGRLTVFGTAVDRIMTTDSEEATGGADTIEGNAGYDIMIGGVNNGGIDVMYGDRETPTTASKANDRDDVLLGDNGELDFTYLADTDRTTLDLISAYPDGLGGVDWLSGNSGSDVGIGGNDGDKIYGDDDTASAGVLDTGDILLGDNADIYLIGMTGQRIVLQTAVDRIVTTDNMESTGGADLIEGNANADIIVGGVNDGGQDDLYGDAAKPVGSLDGDDILLGDNAQLDWTFTDTDNRNTLDLIATITYASDGTTVLGGRDNIFGNAGDDVALGGSFGDLIIGDNDEDGDERAPGKADLLEAFAGADILIGDQGQLIYKGGMIARIETTDSKETDGGVDYIEGNDHADILIGGVYGDILIGESQFGNAGQQGADYVGTPGADILIGDEGRLRYDVLSSETLVDVVGTTGVVASGYATGDDNPLTLDLIETFKTGDSSDVPTGKLGGIDWIFGNESADIAMGGTDGDHIYGDFYATLTLDIATWEVIAPATDVTPARAPDPGMDTLIGDGGQITYHDGQTTLVRSLEPGHGGFDRIQGNDLADTIIGGQAGDWLWGEAPYDDLDLVQAGDASPRGGNDWILGDNGRLDYILVSDTVAGRPDIVSVTLDGERNTLDRVSTTDPTLGGDDVIRGDAANDTIFGGTGKDRIWGDTHDSLGGTAPDGLDGKDLVFGDHGKVYPTLPIANPSYLHNNFFAIDTQEADLGNDDVIFGNGNDDTLLGQQGDDVIFGGTEYDILIGGHNVLNGHDEMDDMDQAQQDAILGSILADKNPSDNNDINDVMDGGSEEDILAGDNAIVIRQTNSVSPRFQYLTGTEIYSMVDQSLAGGLITVNVGFTSNVADDPQAKPDSTVGYTVTLINHSANVESNAATDETDPRWFGNDVMAGGSEDDLLFGELGDDIMQGDGSVDFNNTVKTYDPSPTADPSFTVLDGVLYFQVDDELRNQDLAVGMKLLFKVDERVTDGDDYLEGNGGNDRMYGNLGQDDMIGGSSVLFGLDDATAAFYGVAAEDFARPDGADLMYGGAGNPVRLARNDFVGAGTTGTTVDDDPQIALENRHAHDADVMMGDNANIYRVLTEPSGDYEHFNYDLTYNNSVTAVFKENRGDLRIKPRAVELLDYEYSFDDSDPFDIKASWTGIGYGDLMYGESGDDILHGMSGDDVLFGNSEDDDLYGEIGADWISGGTGIDGILGDDGLLLTSRNSLLGEPLYGIAANNPAQGPLKPNDEVDLNALNAEISTPGNIQRAIINLDGEIKKTVDLISFDTDDIGPQFNDILYGGLGDDWMHAGDGDDAMLGGEALPFYYTNASVTVEADTYSANQLLQIQQQEPANLGLSNAADPFWFDFAPYNPGDILRYEGETILDPDGDRHGKTRQEFALYDEYWPRRKLMLDAEGNAVELSVNAVYDFLLNFNQKEGPLGIAYLGDPAAMATDGDDRMFGDTGNDWMVGGTGRDNMYGGRGDDLLNMDDDHDTETYQPKPAPKQVPGDLENNQPDEYQAYADIAYGGAGRDILILNTGADRAIDWVGEYNSYVVPFSPFGAFHISRTLQPQLPEFLLALSDSDGADQTIPHGTLYVEQKNADVRTDDPSAPEFAFRQGEPYGELGMVRQTDYDWQAQTGAPNDPQPGNLQGKREIMRRELFSVPLANTAFAADVGTLSVSNGFLNVAPDALGGEAVGLYFLDMVQPGYMEILATINMAKDKAGWKSNGYIIFDYQGPDNFKFAGIDAGIDKIQIGHRTASGWVIDAQIPLQLRDGINYNLTLAMYGSVATLWVDQKYSLNFDFQEALNDDGMIGLGTNGAITKFDNWQVQKLPPNFTLIETSDFSTNHPFSTQGDWSVANGVFVGTAGLNGYALAIRSLDVGAYTRLEFDAILNTSASGGVVFDYYNADDFKFAALLPGTDKVIIGHHKDGKWYVDAEATLVLDNGKNYTMTVSLFGTSVSVLVDGKAVVGYVYGSLLNDGGFGLLAKDGTASFDTFTVRSDDPSFAAPVAQTALMAASAAPVSAEPAETISTVPVELVDAAKAYWQKFLGDQAAALDNITIEVADLGGLMLGQRDANIIRIDDDAAGYGWFIDETPQDSTEFLRRGGKGQGVGHDTFQATRQSDAAGHMDLLTVLTHEMGHLLGFDHDAAWSVMDADLDAGTRILPQKTATVAAPGKTVSMAARETLIFDDGRGVFRDLLQGALGKWTDGRAGKRGASALTDWQGEEDPFWMVEM